MVGGSVPDSDDNSLVEPDYPEIARGRAAVGDRVWHGMPMVWPEARPSKQAVGSLGEKLARTVLAQKTGFPFEPVDSTRNNAPLDIWGDGLAVEVKTGLATNGYSAMHWRATIGEPGEEEKAAVDKLSPEEYKTHRDWKTSQIIHRKNSLLADLNKAVPGRKLKGVTVGVILHPSLEKADVYLIEGFHLYLAWKDNATDANFIGTYNIKKPGPKAEKAGDMISDEDDNPKTWGELSAEAIERVQAIRTIVLLWFDKEEFLIYTRIQ